jgi:perosamine synthetase
MVVTDNKAIAEKARYFRNMAFQKKTRYLHKDIGFNYRMTNLQAAVGLAQLRRVNSLIAKKRRIARWYNERLSRIEGISIPNEESWAKNVYWMYGILIDEKSFRLTRDEFREELYRKAIDTRSFFIPMHRQPVFRSSGLFASERYPISEGISRRGLYLPSGIPLTEERVDFVCSVIKQIRKKHARNF